LRGSGIPSAVRSRTSFLRDGCLELAVLGDELRVEGDEDDMARLPAGASVSEKSESGMICPGRPARTDIGSSDGLIAMGRMVPSMADSKAAHV
jgi:hypothetical protein